MKKADFLLLLEDVIEADPHTLTGNEILRQVDGWDSMAVMGFIALVDEQFDLNLAPKRISECKTVDDLIALLGDRIA